MATTIKLQSYTLYAGEAWGPIQVTINDDSTTYQSCVARLIQPYGNTPSTNIGFTNITLNEQMTATGAPNVFNLTIRKTEMDKLLADADNPGRGLRYNTVQVLAIAYSDTASPDPLTDSGVTLKSTDIQVFLTGRGVGLAS